MIEIDAAGSKAPKGRYLKFRINFREDSHDRDRPLYHWLYHKKPGSHIHGVDAPEGYSEAHPFNN